MAHLGAGQFGEVSRGVWKNGKNSTNVAVKSFVASKTEDKTISRVKLLQEAIIMGQFTNPNVIHFYGMVIAKDRVREIGTQNSDSNVICDTDNASNGNGSKRRSRAPSTFNGPGVSSLKKLFGLIKT